MDNKQALSLAMVGGITVLSGLLGFKAIKEIIEICKEQKQIDELRKVIDDINIKLGIEI